jgi:LemA protein
MEILLGLIVAVILVVIVWYNKLIGLKEAVFTDEKGIGIQLDERNKLFDSLVNVVKKYMKHEDETFSKIVKLRSQTNQTTGVATDATAQAAQEELSKMVSSGALSSGINIAVEAYPELKSATNMLQLQESIENIERKLANSKKAFNMSIEDYNTTSQGIPGVLVVSMFKKQLSFDFVRWELSREKIEKAEERVVSFD